MERRQEKTGRSRQAATTAAWTHKRLVGHTCTFCRVITAKHLAQPKPKSRRKTNFAFCSNPTVARPGGKRFGDSARPFRETSLARHDLHPGVDYHVVMNFDVALAI
jgi:hypothetical protein